MTTRQALLGLLVVALVFTAVFAVTRWSAEVADDANLPTDVDVDG